MTALLVTAGAVLALLAAYHAYGRYLSRNVFRLDDQAVVPARELEDGVDYVPTRKSVIFGHHFTSIAGTGPIVGPAIAVFWGWLPALLWVVFGAIFIGAVHDFGSLVVSLRSRGQSVADAAGRLISPRARVLILLIMFFALALFTGILGLVIAVILTAYPGTVIALWISMPIAVLLGIHIHRGTGLFLPHLILAVAVIYGSLYFGVYHAPISLTDLLGVPLTASSDTGFLSGLGSAVVIWTAILMVYSYVASVLPVWVLLQPRDFVNSIQLFVGLAAFVLGVAVARPELVAPAVNPTPPSDAPSLLPFLFITVACGAVSGFHSIVATGTTSKQIARETDARAVAYGGMLMEGGLAVLVIMACAAGLGLGVARDGIDELVTGTAAWQTYYGGLWGDMTLGVKVSAFVEGSANLMHAYGIPVELAVGISALMVASFAATSIDTSTRLQRYVLQELGGMVRFRPLQNKYGATLAAVGVASVLAFIPGPKGPGSGGLILWPLFGTTNQLLAGMGLLVVAFFLSRYSRPVWFLAVPMAFMVVMPAWALVHNIRVWYASGDWLLFGIGCAVQLLQIWMVAEGIVMWRRARGVEPRPLGTTPADPRH
jgi:carbon starvation protein